MRLSPARATAPLQSIISASAPGLRGLRRHGAAVPAAAAAAAGPCLARHARANTTAAGDVAAAAAGRPDPEDATATGSQQGHAGSEGQGQEQGHDTHTHTDTSPAHAPGNFIYPTGKTPPVRMVPPPRGVGPRKLPKAAAEAFVAARAPYAANTYAKPDIVFTRGKGPLLWDLQGRRYTDFTAGIGVCALGHGDARVAELVAEQAGQLLHTSNLFHNYWSLELARALVAATRTAGAFPAAAQVFLSNSGTEANEAAIKFARLRARSLDPSGAKSGIVSFHGSFHGRTFGALSATPTEKYRAPFAPMVPGFSHAAFNDVAALRDAVTPATAGVIVEPIQGEGGINPATPEFLHALRARCDEVGAVLIFDEIQCGLGRTGSLWAHANKHAFGLAGAGTDGARQLVFPDILTSAKALGNGLPIGATLISEEVGSHIQPGHHGTTYGGGPLACAVATHVVNRLCSPEVMSNVAHRSAQFDAALQQLADRYPQAIKEKRVRGLMIGLQLHDAYVPKISQIVQYCRDEGLLILTAGTGVIRLLPPLIISKLRVAEGCEIMERAIRRVVAETEGGAAH